MRGRLDNRVGEVAAGIFGISPVEQNGGPTYVHTFTLSGRRYKPMQRYQSLFLEYLRGYRIVNHRGRNKLASLR